MVDKAVRYLFPGWKHISSMRWGPLVAEKQTSYSLWIQHGYHKPHGFLIFLHGLLCTSWVNLSGVSIDGHCFHVNKHQDDQMTGINIQTEGHTLTPPRGQNGPEDPEAFGSTPSHSPSQSPARKSIPDWPKTWYCLIIQVTSTGDERMTTHHLMHSRHQLWKTWFKMAMQV